MARLKRTIRRENETAIAPDGSTAAASADLRARFLSTIRSRRDIRIDRNAATAPSMNAGAVVWEMTVLN
jgi:hypothetical protein